MASGARSLGCFGQIVALPRRPGQGCRGSAVLVESSSRPSGARAAQHLLRSKAAVTGRRRFVVVESELASKPDEMRALLRLGPRRPGRQPRPDAAATRSGRVGRRPNTASDCGLGCSGGETRTRNQRITSPPRPVSPTCGNGSIWPLTCSFAYSALPIVSHRFAASRGPSAARRRPGRLELSVGELHERLFLQVDSRSEFVECGLQL